MSGEWTCSCPIGECRSAGSRGCYFGTTPTPEPSEVAETTAGEREIAALLGEHELNLGALRRDRETEAGYWLACACGFEWTPIEPFDQHRHHLAAVLAAHVSAAETKARADERERIAKAIQAAKPFHPTRNYTEVDAAYDNAASIARGDAR